MAEQESDIAPDARVLTRTQQIVFSLLKQHRGEIVTTRAIMVHLYKGRTMPPSQRIVRVFICHIRRWLLEIKAPLEIANVPQRGYILQNIKGASNNVF